MSKNVVKGLRVTPAVDSLLEGVADTCQKYDIRINGNGGVSVSTLLSFFWESITHAQNRTQKLEELLIMLELKDSRGNKLNPGLIKLIAEEVIEHGRP